MTLIWVIIILFLAFIVRREPTALLVLAFLVSLLPESGDEPCHTKRTKRGQPQRKTQSIEQGMLKKRYRK